MTNSLFFDSDCISAFLWVNEQNLLTLLYPGRVVIPKPAYDELSYPTTPHLKQRIDYLIKNKQASLATINVNSDMYALYQKLTSSPGEGHKIIGPGEAASIVLAKTNNGIVASNNLKDISSYISEFELKHITTGDILIQALEKGYISEDDGNAIWALMLAKRRKLGAPSFSEYIKLKKKDT
jgi:predicted nucleic acid-binding protein